MRVRVYSSALPDQSALPWLQFVENLAVAEALSVATGGTNEFQDGESHCVCDVGYSGDACEIAYMPALPDPCVPQQILISGECQTYQGATEPEPGTFDLAENLHNGRPYWIGGSGLLLYYVPAAVVAPPAPLAALAAAAAAAAVACPGSAAAAMPPPPPPGGMNLSES